MRPLITLALAATSLSILLSDGRACGEEDAALAAAPTVGVLRNDQRARPGYTLLAPMSFAAPAESRKAE